MKKLETVKKSAEQQTGSLIEEMERAEWLELLDRVSTLAGQMKLTEEQIARTGEETNARLAEIEQELFNQRPDMERFVKNIGPMVDAAQKLREEIKDYEGEILENLASNREQLQEILRAETEGLEELLKQPGIDRNEICRMALACMSAAKECANAANQIAGAREDSLQAIEGISERTSIWMSSESLKLTQEVATVHRLYQNLKEKLWAKTLAVATASALVGALIGSLVISIYTMSRIDTIAETEHAAAKWTYLIKKRETERQGSGEELNRQIEQEMVNNTSH